MIKVHITCMIITTYLISATENGNISQNGHFKETWTISKHMITPSLLIKSKNYINLVHRCVIKTVKIVRVWITVFVLVVIRILIYLKEGV